MLRPDFPIVTARLRLRPFADADLEAVFAMQSRSDVTRYLPWGPRSREEVAEIVERLKQMTGFHEASQSLRLAATLPQSGEVIGDISLWLRSAEHRTGEIGFVIHPDQQGRGYATEAAAAMLRLGFEEADLHRIVASADARNIGSIRVMQRLGMREEAHFRENELVEGEWTDEVVFAILDRDWRTSLVQGC